MSFVISIVILWLNTPRCQSLIVLVYRQMSVEVRHVVIGMKAE
jgi:hypothetical protein